MDYTTYNEQSELELRLRISHLRLETYHAHPTYIQANNKARGIQANQKEYKHSKKQDQNLQIFLKIWPAHTKTSQCPHCGN